MSAASKLSEAEVAALIATLQASGVNVKDILAEKTQSPTASIESVRVLPEDKPDATTEATSQRKRKGSAGEGSSSKRLKPTPAKTPVRKSGRIKKTQAPVVKKEQSVTEAEEEEFLKGRAVISELTVDREFMARHQLVEVCDILIAQGWEHLFREAVLVDDITVREFYSQFKLEEMHGMPLATFVIGGMRQVFTYRELANLLNAPASGYDEYVKGIWPESVAKGEVIRRVGEDPSNVSHQGKAAKLSLINRILHKLICTSVTPRTQKHEVVNFQDFLLLDKLKGKTQINFPMLILKHIERAASSKTHGLPYPGIVKKILVHLGIYRPEIESEFSSTLGEQTIASFNWKFEEETGWQNNKYAPAPAPAEAPQEVDPLDQRPLDPDEGSPAVIEVLKSLGAKMDVLSAKVARIESLVEKEFTRTELGWVSEVRSKLEDLESLPTLLKEVEESAKINMVQGTQIREEIVELNRQLKFEGTELVEQLRLLVKK